MDIKYVCIEWQKPNCKSFTGHKKFNIKEGYKGEGTYYSNEESVKNFINELKGKVTALKVYEYPNGKNRKMIYKWTASEDEEVEALKKARQSTKEAILKKIAELEAELEKQRKRLEEL